MISEPLPERFSNPLARYLAATRPAFLSVTLVACLIGLATAHASGLPIDVVKAVLTVLFALVAHGGVNVINDYHDAVSGADAANSERVFPFTGGSRFIQNGVLSQGETAVLGYGLLLLVVPAGLWLTLHSAPALVAIGLAGLFVGWAYSAPPLKLMCRGLGELAIVTGWLLVGMGSDFVQRGDFALLPAAAALPFALLVAAILYINQFPDRAGDAAAGKNTVVVRLGPARARWGYLLLVGLAGLLVVLAVAAGVLPPAGLACLLALPLSILAGSQLLRHADHPAQLVPAIKSTILAANLHGLLMAGALWLALPGIAP